MAIIFGIVDVLNVSFSEQKTINADVMIILDNNLEGSSQRLIIIFAFVGWGCILGPT